MNLRAHLSRACAPLVAIAVLLTGRYPHAEQPADPAATLAPTNHPRLPRDLSQLWLVPQTRPAVRTAIQRDFAEGVRLEVAESFTKALPIFQQPAMKQGPLASYAEYYAGLAQLRLGRMDEACRTFQTLQAHAPIGFVAEAAALREAECHEALGERTAALAVYERLSTMKTASPDEVLLHLGRTAKFSGNAEKARQAFTYLYYDLPLSDYSQSAGLELEGGPLAPGSTRFTLRLGRAERLYQAKRYPQARSEFESLRFAAAPGNDRELVDLRIAECDFYLKRYRDAKLALRPYLDSASRRAEAIYFYALTLRALNETEAYLRSIRQVADQFPVESWADEALDDLASYYVVTDKDEQADEVYRRLYERFPTGHNAERAAWKIGWWSYRKRNFADTVRVFDRAAVDFPRSDYRPMWLYWSGRAYAALGQNELAIARYTLEITDYANTYHGRLTAKRLAELNVTLPERRLIVDVKSADGGSAAGGEVPRLELPPNGPVIRALLDLELYDQAVDELRYAQRVWGASSPLEATLAWIYWQQGRSLTGTDQFSRYRGAINAMKRAYPHYLAAGGENLPGEILKIIYPVSYWDSIRKYAEQFNVDPYMSVALIAQESTFVPDIKSYANAWGLTQLMPATARQYARTLNLTYTPKLLTDPESNLRIGMAYLSAKMREFGQMHLAIASYNAGERAVHRWVNERPDVPEDEFIDDIPYPQTNNYVKKLLSTAEDYRRLYSSPARIDDVLATAAPVKASSPASPAKAAVSTRPRSKPAPATAAKKPAAKATRKAPRKAA